MIETAPLVENLPVLQRLALAYCPAKAKLPTLSLLALDTRLAAILRGSSEPMLAQLRFAWWREALGQESARWPQGEPLLAALRSWEGEFGTLAGLVEGWEAMTGAAPLPPSSMETLAKARGEAFGGLARLVGAGPDSGAAIRMGCNWALVDLASRLSHPEERRLALDLAERQDWGRTQLARALRPLAVLSGLASRGLRRGKAMDELSPAAFATATRLGLLGL